MHVQQSSIIEVSPEQWLSMGLSPAALDLLRDKMTSAGFIQALKGRLYFEDALRVIAHVLAVPVGIRWGLTAIRKTCPASLEGAGEVVAAVDAWLAEPNDDRRRAAFAAAEATGLGSPAGCLGLAVFLSGGSLAPPQAPEVLPQPFLAARGVIGGLMMAAVFDTPQAAAARIRTFVESGVPLLTEPSRQV